MDTFFFQNAAFKFVIECLFVLSMVFEIETNSVSLNGKVNTKHLKKKKKKSVFWDYFIKWTLFKNILT